MKSETKYEKKRRVKIVNTKKIKIQSIYNADRVVYIKLIIYKMYRDRWVSKKKNRWREYKVLYIIRLDNKRDKESEMESIKDHMFM